MVVMAPMSTMFARAAEPTGSNPQELVYTSAIVFAFFSLLVTFLIIPPLVQHWRNRNIGATLCVFYAMIMNLMAFINAVLWPNDDLEHWYNGSGLCDVEVKLQIAWSVAAPATLICVLRALANAMDTERLSLSKTRAQRWRGYAIDLTLCVGIPLLSMIFYFIVQSKRYFLYGISGCVPTATQSYLTVGLIYIPPLLLVLVDAYFALLILYRLCRYRRTFSIILAHNDTTKSRFLRLYILCIVWLLGIIPLSSWMLSVNLGSQQEPYKWVEAHDYSKWNEIVVIPSNGNIVFDRFIWLGCGIMVFLTFGFAIGIPDRTNGQADGLNRTVSNSYNDLATSPNASFQSPPGSFGGRLAASAKSLKPFHTQDIKVLLLENVNKTGQDILKKQGYQIEILKSSLPENELIEKIQDVHVIGIRSKTQLTANVLKHAKNLIVIGCFCIGTNQVDLKYAAENGIAVFNSPFSNSRSVAEQMIGEIISLARQIGDRNNELHQGVWNKVSAGCWEVRGKTLGIVGYGHVGSQLSVLAEAMGMRVIYYDVVNLMSLGTSNQVPSLDALLQQADFVTLHVPELPETINMISSKQFEQMKNGSYLLNASRGTVVDIPALIKASQAGKLAGAALDVYPNEPAGNGPKFTNELNTWAEELRNLKNIILTPHIGGSTEEAQAAIGIEVADALVNYVNFGTTAGAVNMPEVTLRSLTIEEPNHVRVIYIHKNIPGVLRRVNEILGDHNVDKQMTDSRGDVAYLMADISNVNISEIQQLYQSLEDLGSRIRTRVLY
ncbi:hypothetical protein BTJ68_11274 [Hortaea werneckii EXF-2000]|uniref:2-oxoglutarate reductase n=1 Tax=Hortaea werneckii EXF-2000 TaxID=1157616 RepID=A0A1Z5SXG7_HORWE|nr:hypothetical protein BTJ68_11274 [Hortaea werneckii EXF-2000]